MTASSPTWGDIERFVQADRWRQIPSSERGGRSSDHVFYDKTLPDGRLLQTHISHSRKKSMSPGRFGAILTRQLEVSRDEFWECIRSGRPVDRPVPLDEPDERLNPAWVVNVLVGELHLSAEQIAALSPEAAEQLVHDHWAAR